jgi:hypothetical protein
VVFRKEGSFWKFLTNIPGGKVKYDPRIFRTKENAIAAAEEDYFNKKKGLRTRNS